MTESYSIDGVATGLVRDDTPQLVESADHGNVGSGSLTIDDMDGDYAVVGHKQVVVEQDECSVPRTFTGYVGQRTYKRTAPPQGTARQIEVSLLDLNARLGFYVIRGRAWNRPRETVAERMTALLASAFLAPLVIDDGFVDYPTHELDKNDYRSQFPLDVIRDCALEVGFNYFVYWSDTADDAALWFRDSNASTAFSSTLRISNVLTDVDDSTTFEAGKANQLTRDPSQVYSGVQVPFTKGLVFRARAATSIAYEPRHAVAPNSQVKKRSKAIELADQFLFERRNEEDVITDEILLPKTHVNLVRAGQRIEARYSDFTTEGYGDFNWFRILETRKQPIAKESLYKVGLTLSPQEAAGCDTQPAIVQQKEVAFVGDTDITFDNPVTVGNVIVAIGAKTGITAASMGSYTELGQAYHDDCCGNNGTVATTFAFATVATTTGQTYSREATSAHFQWRLYELSGVDISDVEVLTVSHHDEAGAVSATLDLGTLSAQKAVALMVTSVGRSTDQRATGGTYGMASWNERYNDQFDPTFGPPLPSPWIGIGDLTSTGSAIPAAWVYTEGVSGQGIGEWCGVAVAFGNGCGEVTGSTDTDAGGEVPGTGESDAGDRTTGPTETCAGLSGLEFKFPCSALSVGSMPAHVSAGTDDWDMFTSDLYSGSNPFSAVTDPAGSGLVVVKNINRLGDSEKHTTHGTGRDMPKGNTSYAAVSWLWQDSGEFTPEGWCLVWQRQMVGSPIAALAVNDATNHWFMSSRNGTVQTKYDLGAIQYGHWAFLVCGIHLDDAPYGWIEWWFAHDGWPDVTAPPLGARAGIQTWQGRTAHDTVGMYAEHFSGSSTEYIGYHLEYGRAATAARAIEIARAT